jgi:hypothetical protein
MSNLRGKGVALYHLTLTTATAIPHAVYGNFSAKGQSEICVSRGKVLQLLRPDSRGQIQVCSTRHAVAEQDLPSRAQCHVTVQACVALLLTPKC